MIMKAPREGRREARTEGPRTKGQTVLLAVRIFLLVLFQVTVVSRLGFFGAVPDVLLSYLVVLSVTGRRANGWKTLSVSGLALGFLADAIGGVGIPLLGLFYFLVGAVLPNLVRREERNALYELLVSFTVLLPIALLRAGITLLSALLTKVGGFSFLLCLRNVLLPELLGTLVFLLPVFLLFRGRD